MNELAVGFTVVALVALLTAQVVRRLPATAGAVPWLAVVVSTMVAATAFLNRPFGSGTDERIYQDQAASVRLSLVLTGQVDSDYSLLDPGKAGWSTILGTVYYVTGSENPYLGIIINASVTFLAIFLAVAAGARLHPDMRWREWMGMVLIASPPMVLFGATLLRECWAWLSVSVAIHGLIWLVRRRLWTGSLTTIVAVLSAFWIRAPLAPILFGATIAGVIISIIWQRYGTRGAVIVFLSLGLAGRLALTFALAAVGYSPEALFVARDYLAESATTGFPPADPFTAVGLVESLVRVGLGPMPWEFRPAPAWAWVFLNWAYWAVIVVLTCKAIRRVGLNRSNVAVIAFAVVLLAGLAVGLTNYGIVVRMRATAIVALLPLMMGMLAPIHLRAHAPNASEPAREHAPGELP